MADRAPTYVTSLATSTPTEITILGRDMADDMLGKVTFGELAFWLIQLRRPSPGELRLFEAVLVALTDHGFTPAAISARMTYFSAPDSIQGAVAAGILNGGSRFLGVAEETGRMLSQAVQGAGDELPKEETGWDQLASAVLSGLPKGQPVPGIGHPVHKAGDPRVPALMAIASEEGLFGPHLSLLLAVGRMSETHLGRRLPVNGAGACGAVLVDLGFPVAIVRGIALLARSAGLVGQLAEEQRNPIAPTIYTSVDRNTEYHPPDGGTT